jgi:hypothetical protein
VAKQLAGIKGEVSQVRLGGRGGHLAVAFAEGGFKLWEWPAMKLKIDSEEAAR